jgi:hypothetical protein
MATTMTNPCIEQIGETAGRVWQILNADGPMSLAKLAKDAEIPRDLVMQAVGWLAREGKIWLEDRGRVRMVGLR